MTAVHLSVPLLFGLFGCLGETVEVPRELTAEELAACCTPEVLAARDELSVAQSRVSELERTSAEQEGKVRDLEDRIARGAEAGKAQRDELARLKAELAGTQDRLVIAEAEKTRLLDDLRETQQELASTQERLVVTTDQRDLAREDALANRWRAFLNDAQLEICEKGNRKKLGNCREVVAASLDAPQRRDRFAHCVRSGQAQPLVHEQEGTGELPKYAEMLDEAAKQVKGWYVEYCDPTLPESADAPLSEAHLPPAAPP